MLSIQGIGIDIIEVSKFSQDTITRDFLTQVFTDQERTQGSANQKQSLAAIFAAKEAFFKALRIGLHYGSYWQQIQITDTQKGIISAPLKKFLEKTDKIHIAQSCSRRYALSMVIVEK